jgi:uncharacterized protein YqgV (UPF0045/DUF77 family)
MVFIMMTLLSIQMIPKIAQNQTTKIEPADIVDKIIEHIQSTGLKYEVGAMETTIEGTLSELLNLVEILHPLSIQFGAERVITNIKIDYRPTGITFSEKMTKYR